MATATELATIAGITDALTRLADCGQLHTVLGALSRAMGDDDLWDEVCTKGKADGEAALTALLDAMPTQE